MVTRLVELLDSSEWTLRAEAEELLIQYYTNCRSIIEKNLNLAREPAATSLRRVAIKGCASSGLPLPQYLSEGIKKDGQ